MSNLQTTVSIEQLFQSKESRRLALAAKPIEEKLELLVKLQQMTSDFSRQAGREVKKPWVLKHKDLQLPDT